MNEREAVQQLRQIVKPGDTLHTILRHTSRSGMAHSISVLKIDGRGKVHRLDWLIVHALDMRMDRDNAGVKVNGAGMDMGFDLVYSVSVKLYGHGNPRGYPCLGQKCPSNSHVNERNAPSGKGVRHRDGYALSHRWL